MNKTYGRDSISIIHNTIPSDSQVSRETKRFHQMKLKWDKFWGSLNNPFAQLGRISARHPIQVIITTLLLSSIAYISLIRSYLLEWEEISSNIDIPLEIGKDDLLTECTHYHRNTIEDPWSSITFKEFSRLNEMDHIRHVYLYPVNFHKRWQLSSSYPVSWPLDHSKPDIYGQGGFNYLVEDHLLLPSKLLENEPGMENWLPIISEESLKRSLQRIQFGFERMLKIKQLEFTDVIIVLGSYSILAYTIINLFNELRNLGSRLWLSFSILLSLSCSCCMAISVSKNFFDIYISTFTLIQGLPFLIVIIGFKNKINLSRYTMERFGIINISRKITIDSVLFDAMTREGINILKSYIFSILIFLVVIVALPTQKLARDFSIMSCLILGFDFLMTTTFYSAILALKMEINAIHRSTMIRQTLEEEGTSKVTSANLSVVDDKLKSSFLNSNLSVLMAKGFIIICILAINLYSIDFQWLFNTLSALYFHLIVKESLPPFVNDNSTLTNTIISVLPTQYYQWRQNITVGSKPGNITINLLKILGNTVSDTFISKIIFIALLISVSTNIYLLKAAKIHTDYTVGALYKNLLSTEKPTPPPHNIVSHRNVSSGRSRTHSPLAMNPVTPPTFSLNVSDDEETPESSGTSTPSDLSETSIESLMKALHHDDNDKLIDMENNKIISLVLANKLPLYSLENKLGDKTRAVEIRRSVISILTKTTSLRRDRVPYKNYDYNRVFGTCCENVVGYLPIPVGIAGPLIIDGEPFHIPMATTEGCLVASTMRGCKAINSGGGVVTVLTKDGMTRGPCVKFPNLARAGACKMWLDSEEGQTSIKKAFNSTSRFAKLQHIKTAITGDLLFIRFVTTTGDAMGMNMISKGVEFSLDQMLTVFGWDDMKIVAISGNYCTDKKAAAINWIEGRGKSVVAEAIIPKDVVTTVLKSDVKALVELNVSKNLVGSAVAGALGGFNAHAANIVTALFIALGQDPAQNIESSNCITLMSEEEENLKISVTMPSIEVGTIGGGTILEAQGALLDLLGVRGPHPNEPGNNAKKLARIVASAVLAGELSLCAALAAGQLVQSHMSFNRYKGPKSNGVDFSPKKTN